jgi:hypothetical protein
MMRLGLVVLRISLALVGGVALYALLYGATGWIAETAGYESPVGHAFGFVNGLLSPLSFGFVAIPLFVVLLFLVLTKFAFVTRATRKE